MGLWTAIQWSTSIDLCSTVSWPVILLVHGLGSNGLDWLLHGHGSIDPLSYWSIDMGLMVDSDTPLKTKIHCCGGSHLWTSIPWSVWMGSIRQVCQGLMELVYEVESHGPRSGDRSLHLGHKWSNRDTEIYRIASHGLWVLVNRLRSNNLFRLVFAIGSIGFLGLDYRNVSYGLNGLLYKVRSYGLSQWVYGQGSNDLSRYWSIEYYPTSVYRLINGQGSNSLLVLMYRLGSNSLLFLVYWLGSNVLERKFLDTGKNTRAQQGWIPDRQYCPHARFQHIDDYSVTTLIILWNSWLCQWYVQQKDWVWMVSMTWGRVQLLIRSDSTTKFK